MGFWIALALVSGLGLGAWYGYMKGLETAIRVLDEEAEKRKAANNERY